MKFDNIYEKEENTSSTIRANLSLYGFLAKSEFFFNGNETGPTRLFIPYVTIWKSKNRDKLMGKYSYIRKVVRNSKLYSPQFLQEKGNPFFSLHNMEVFIIVIARAGHITMV